MRELKKSFTGIGQVRGYAFNQITATPYGYIYTKTNSMGSKSFEVFKRVKNRRFDCISYPSDKAFGIWAWNVGTLERAQEVLAEITHQEIRKLTIN